MKGWLALFQLLRFCMCGDTPGAIVLKDLCVNRRHCSFQGPKASPMQSMKVLIFGNPCAKL